MGPCPGAGGEVAGRQVRGRRPPAPGAPVRRRAGGRGASRGATAGGQPTGAGDWRDRARLPLRLLAARRPAGRVPGAAGPRSGTRPAGGDPHPGGRSRYPCAHRRGPSRRPAGRRVPLFHRRSRHGQPGARHRFYLSFAGILTFPRAVELREAVRIVPLDRLLVETDAPYLAPVPHRGKRNEPAWVAATFAAVAAARDVPVAALAATVRDNYDRLFEGPQIAQPQGLSGPAPR